MLDITVVNRAEINFIINSIEEDAINTEDLYTLKIITWNIFLSLQKLERWEEAEYFVCLLHVVSLPQL